MRISSCLGLALALILSCSCAQAAELRVVIDGVASSKGTLMLGLYDSEEHFQLAISNAAKLSLVDNPSRLVGIAMRAAAGAQSVVFTNLKPGTYAVIVIHDENDDGKLDEGLFGAPIEGYGFSNNAAGFFAAPSFKDAGVLLGAADRAITITLKYPAGVLPRRKQN
jgi:uncharacterized protein (DUF2141 family)